VSGRGRTRKKLVLCTGRCERVADVYLAFANRDHHHPPTRHWRTHLLHFVDGGATGRDATSASGCGRLTSV
jgi:hypothetical protein